MNINFKNWLINKGYAQYTANRKPSTVYDYMTGVLYVCKWEQKSIDELADNISSILPKYVNGGEYFVRGRMRSRSVRCGLKAFDKFITESRAA